MTIKEIFKKYNEDYFPNRNEINPLALIHIIVSEIFDNDVELIDTIDVCFNEDEGVMCTKIYKVDDGYIAVCGYDYITNECIDEVYQDCNFGVIYIVEPHEEKIIRYNRVSQIKENIGKRYW